MKIKKYIISLLPLILIACSSSSKRGDEPTWIHEPARIVDNGYIVYVAHADALSQERAQFNAEGLALEDLANECSLIPKGTRIEDRYSENSDHKSFTTYIKIGLEFQACENAKKTIQPEEIKALASLPFSEQLHRYQDLEETGEMPTASEASEPIHPPEQYTAEPVQQKGYSDNTHFFVVRQYVAYQKQIVVLSPPTAYAPGSPENQRFVTSVEPSVQRVQMSEREHPEFVKQRTTWSTLRDRPHIERPQSLSAAAVNRHQMSSRTVKPIENPNRNREKENHQKGNGNKRSKKRRRRNRDEN